MSFLTNSPGFNLTVGNITCNELNANDVVHDNLLITGNLGVGGDTAITGSLELVKNASPWMNLTGTQGQVLGMGALNNLAWISITAQGSITGSNNITIGVVADVHTINLNNDINLQQVLTTPPFNYNQ